MNHLRSTTKIALSLFIICLCCQFGCRPQQPVFLSEKGRWQNHLITKATKIEIPNVDVQSLPEVCYTTEPFTLDDPDPEAMWDLTLEETIQITMKNSKVIRTLTGVGFSQGGVSGVPGTLLQGSNRSTVYDPALMESDPNYGIEAALAAFDAQLTAGLSWNGSNYSGDGRDFNIGISKYGATGTRYFLNHTHGFDSSSYGNPWSSGLRGGFSHPLLQGGGVEFNRIAGPSGMVGRYGGVSIARINTDMSLNDFEMATRNLVADVERAYWNLYYAYHRLHSVRSGRDAAYETWRQTKAHFDASSAKGRAYMLRQAEQNYFEFRQQTELAQNNLFRAESALRYSMGLTASDRRLIRPTDDPITAPVSLDWNNIMCEALFRSPELRKSKWSVKQRELELIASKNFLLPRLDLEGGYNIAGGGDNLIRNKQSAYTSLANGENTGWSMGMSLSAPFGWRQELAGVRNAQLSLAKARALLREQEYELTHQLADSKREITLTYQQMQTTLAKYRSATEEVNAVKAAFEAETTTLDQVLQAQRRQSEAETGYYSSVIDYNLAIMTLHYRKGSLLEYNNVCLTEGEWPGKAYFDAKRRARERDAGHYFNYGLTLPRVVSRGTYIQHQHGYDSMNYETLPSENNNYVIPPDPNDSLRVIETESTTVIPTPVLPRSGGNSPVSFSTPETATPTLTPTRSLRYVQ